MRRPAAVLLAGPLALVLLSGCADDPAGDPAAAATPAATSSPSATSPPAGPEVVAVADDDQDEHVASIATGQQVSVELATCGGCGYAWSVEASPDPDVATREPAPTAADPAASPAGTAPLVGVPTTTVFAFRGGAQGKTQIRFAYRPPAEEEPERTVVLTLEVTGDAVALPETERASELVAALYAERAGGTLLQDADREAQAAVLTPDLVDLLEADAAAAAGEVGRLDVDLLLGVQDAEVSGLDLAPAALEGRSAVVPVSFTNLGEAQEVVVRLQPVEDDWRISDIAYPDGRTLLGLLRGRA